MGRVINVTGYYVEVIPRVIRPDVDEKEVCLDIINQITKHVDYVRKANLAYDAEAVCEFCGSIWSEDSDIYNGGCCDEDVKRKPIQEGE